MFHPDSLREKKNGTKLPPSHNGRSYHNQDTVTRGKSRKYIAEKIERDLSSIRIEIKRYSDQRGYRPKQAQRKYEERKGRGKVTKSPFEIILYIEEKRKEEYSPEQISGRRPLDIRLRKGALTESRQMAEDSIGKKISGCRSNTTR